MPGDRETDKESQLGLPLSDSVCGHFSRHLHLWLQASLLTEAGAHGDTCVQGHLVTTCVTGEHAPGLGLLQTKQPVETPQDSTIRQ